MIRLIKISAYALFAFLLPLWLYLSTDYSIKKELELQRAADTDKNKSSRDTVVYIINQLAQDKKEPLIISNNSRIEFPDSISINFKNQSNGTSQADIDSQLKGINKALDNINSSFIKDTIQLSNQFKQILESLNNINNSKHQNDSLIEQVQKDLNNIQKQIKDNKKLSAFNAILISLAFALQQITKP